MSLEYYKKFSLFFKNKKKNYVVNVCNENM